MINILKSTFRIIKTLILSLILICLVIFMVNNRETLTIHLFPLPFEIETKIFMVMISFFLFGMFFGMLACSKSIFIRSVTSFQDKRKIKKLEKQVISK